MEDFSKLELQFQSFERESELRTALAQMEGWSDKERAPEKKAERLKRAINDFWEFDRLYFPPELYSGDYSKPCVMHKAIADLAFLPGVNVVFGPRGHGKTATAKKTLAWALLVGEIKLGGVYTENLLKSSAMLNDIAGLIEDNARIMFDFDVDIRKNNADVFEFRTKNKELPSHWRQLGAFSEGRSLRGNTKLFTRPEIVIGDDIETLQSAMGEDSVRQRIGRIAETYKSLKDKVGTFLILANDFDDRCALHRLKLEEKEGLLHPSYRIYNFQAWNEKGYNLQVRETKFRIKKGALWSERYKSKNETDLRIELGAKDHADWAANFQNDPVPPDGITFKREKLAMYESAELPDDARGVVYYDPNISKKGKGDTTAIVFLKFSPKTGYFYIDKLRCRSFDSTRKLLDIVHNMTEGDKAWRGTAQDGHVNQESIWSDAIRAWSREKGIPFRQVEFKRYNIDELAKNVQLAWEDGLILINRHAGPEDEVKAFIQQLISFAGKKANKKDDAPDAFIGSFTFLHERKLAKRGKNLLAETRSISTEALYSF